MVTLFCSSKKQAPERLSIGGLEIEFSVAHLRLYGASLPTVMPAQSSDRNGYAGK